MLIYQYNNCHLDLDIEAYIFFFTSSVAHNLYFSSSNVHVGETYLRYKPSVCDLSPSDYQI